MEVIDLDKLNQITEMITGAAVEGLTPIHEAKVLSYPKLCGCPIGLQVNFNVWQVSQGIKRFRI
jgi:hypothetical protein